MSDRPVVVWFRRDLRTADNPALRAAAESGRPVVACYILDRSDGRPPGSASRWWLHDSLTSLSRALEKLGGRLILQSGEAPERLVAIASAVDAQAVFANALPSPEGRLSEERVASALSERGIALECRHSALLFGPDPVRTGSGGAYKVFTPFMKACLALPAPSVPLPVPKDLNFLDVSIERDDLEDWSLQPRQPNWAQGFEERWRPGEEGAHTRLEAFVEAAMADYPDGRNRPDLPSTSGLSPHLAFGELSPRQAWAAASAASAAGQGADNGARAWQRQLIWREFSYSLLHHWPDFAEAPFRPEFAGFPWRTDDEALMRWQNGITGFPIVDAGMRELWQTGWMHNRVRMIVASFLIKDLLIPWQQGEAWFWDTLVDADPANNPVSWQWVAGSGADAAPYFRIFNPVTQGERYDPAGDYVRKYVPEIAALPDKYLHAPWTAPQSVLDDCGIVLDTHYPAPMVDHKQARERALDAYQSIRS